MILIAWPAGAYRAGRRLPQTILSHLDLWTLRGARAVPLM
jgi:hypothetical protein